MTDFTINFAYGGIALALIGRGVGVPIPEDIPLLAAGFLCAQQTCEIQWMLPVAWLSVILADGLSFWAGRILRGQLPKLPILRLVFSPGRMRQADRFYRRHGLKGLLAARFMPGFRTPLFFTAGTARMPFSKFLCIDLPAALVSVSGLIFLGWYFPSHLEQLHHMADLYKWIALALFALIGGLLLWIKRMQKKD